MSLNQFINIKNKITKQTGINISCYAAVLHEFKQKFPKAHFEIIMRFPGSVGLKYPKSELSPSPKLLHQIKSRLLSFKGFTKKFEEEIFSNKKAINRLKILMDLSKTQEIFLVCCEKDSSSCHRSFIKNYIQNLDYYLEKWRFSKKY